MKNKTTKCSIIELQINQLKAIVKNVLPSSTKELTLEELLNLKESLQSIQASLQDMERLASSSIKQTDRALNTARSLRAKNLKKDQKFFEKLQEDITILYEEAIEIKESESIEENKISIF